MAQSKEEKAAYDKAYRKANPEKVAAYQKANKEKMAAYNKAYRKANKEKVAELTKAWAQNNPEKRRASKAKRRAMKKGVKEDFSAKERLACLERFNHECFKCNSKENLAIDHYRPLSKGNALTRTNAIILCGSCNSSKNDKDPEDYFTGLEMSILEVFWGLEKLKEINHD